MLRVIILTALVAGLFSARVHAATYQYSFDIIKSEIGFIDELKYDSSILFAYNRIPWYLGERESYIKNIHPLGSLYGLTGRVVMDVTAPSTLENGYVDTALISCVSGGLCLPGGDTVSMDERGVLYFDTGMVLGIPETGRDASLIFLGGTGYHIFSCSFLGHSDCTIVFWSETAVFSIANFSRTEITPVPLPAGAPLLAVGVMALGIGTRRRTRAA